jgi:hypothetical protein
MKVAEGRKYRGPAGSATEILLKGEPDRPDWAATVSCWFLECPGQSPAWSRYTMNVIHLRDIENVPPAHIRVPRATHELILIALDPDRHPQPTKLSSWHPLRPLNVQEQIQLPSDQAAHELADKAAQAVVQGLLWAEPPLSGQVEPWRTMLIKLSAHLRGEEHAP